MSEESQDTPRTDPAQPEAGEAAAGPSQDAPRMGEEATARAEAVAAEFRDRYLRAAAEMENFRRRAEKERQDTAKFAIASFARDTLTVLDNLRRGLEAVTTEERNANPTLEALAAGMELTEREMLATLERHGIEKVDPAGQPFDHNLHQAMMEVEDASVASGTVVQVLQAGYVLNGRLLRPAMVAVSRGGPKEAAPARVQAPIANEDLARDAPSGDGTAPADAAARKGNGSDTEGHA